jgi:hypothetical protein
VVAAVSNGGSTVSVPTNPGQDGSPPSGGRKTDSRMQQKAAQRAAVPKQLATNKRKSPSKTGSKTGACCSKDHRLELKEGDGAYFTAMYQRGKPNVPTHFAGYCKQKFVGDDVPKRKVENLTCVKISKSKPASMCPNAQDTNHPCVYALCTQCTFDRDLPGQKKQVYLKDGAWVPTDESIAEDTNEPVNKKRRSRRAKGFREHVVERMVGDTVAEQGVF